MTTKTKIALRAVKNRIAEGMTLEEALACYPKLSAEQVKEIRKALE